MEFVFNYENNPAKILKDTNYREYLENLYHIK